MEQTMNERVKLIRLSQKLTQTEFGKRINRSQSQVTMVEKGFRNVGVLLINDLKNEFNANPKWIETGEGSMFLSSFESIKIDDPEVQKMADLFVKLNKDKRDQVLLELTKAIENIENQ